MAHGRRAARAAHRRLARRHRTGAADRARSPELTADDHLQRACAVHGRLLSRFDRADGLLRPDARLHPRRAVAHLWPFARALVAELDLLGTPGGDEVWPLVARRHEALERYWDERGPAYASDPPGTRMGGDIYYDDNAWAGLALVQLERMRPGAARLDRAAALAAFARGGWDPDRSTVHPGGIFWVQQGRGAGARNHDRNAISTAPNGQLIAHLAELGSDPGGGDEPERCAEWVRGLTGPSGLVRDKIRGDGSVDVANWSYNQGSLIGLHVLLARRGGPEAAVRLDAARQLAGRALDHYEETGYAEEPDEFVAIFVRNLLSLHAAVGDDDAALRERIIATLHERAAAAWDHAGQRRVTLLALSAVLSLQALAAWDPADYPRLA